jgi:MFS family permease
MAAGGLIMGLGGTFGTAALGRLVGGSGGLILNVILTKMAADWFAGREIITAMAFLLSSWPLGVALALVCLGPLAATGSWSLAMYLTTAACLLGLVLILALYRRPDSTGGPKPAGPVRAGLGRQDLTLVGLAAMIWMLYNVSFIILPSFGPAFLSSSGLSPARAGQLTSLVSWILIGSIPLGGYVAEKLGRPNGFLIWCAIGTSLAVLGFGFGLAPLPLLISLGILFGPQAGIIMSLPTQVLSPEKRASGMGFFYSFYYLGLAAIPPLAGLMGDLSGDPAAPLVFGAAVGLGIIPFLVLFRFFQRRGGAGEVHP